MKPNQNKTDDLAIEASRLVLEWETRWSGLCAEWKCCNVTKTKERLAGQGAELRKSIDDLKKLIENSKH